MTEQNDTHKSRSIDKLIGDGAEIAGAAVGGALGFYAAGPEAAALLSAGGSVVGAVLRRVGSDVSKRLLSPRERTRLGAVIAIAADEIRNELEAGKALRSDGFFEHDQHGRSAAEEVAESVLLKSQREPEEKKLPYMAHLLKAASFEADVSAEMAHLITKIAEQLTYRQFCIMKLAAEPARGLRLTSYGHQTQFPEEQFQVIYECFDLYRRSLIHFGGPNARSAAVALGVNDVVPGRMALAGLGSAIYGLMEMTVIPEDDLAP